jgi:cephalosporin-C deacetylase
MPWFDLPLDQLREYRTGTAEPAELAQWWDKRLGEAHAAARPARVTRHEPGIYGPLDVRDVEFSGARGDRIRGWYIRPPGSGDRAVPIVVKFIGYGGGRGMPTEHAALPATGYAVLVMDSRGQGGRWSAGATGDPAGNGTGPENGAVMTRGITTPEDYYFTRLFIDAVRAVETAADLDGADPARIAVSGSSQGGALALAASALTASDLSTAKVAVCHADVPFLCDIQRAITLAPKAPYTEVPEFLAQNVDLIPAALDTLRYIDCALLARRITAQCLLSTGLMDAVCPPSTVFAAYNEITAAKDIAVYLFSSHEVPAAHAERQIRHLRMVLPAG